MAVLQYTYSPAVVGFVGGDKGPRTQTNARPYTRLTYTQHDARMALATHLLELLQQVVRSREIPPV